MEIKLPIFKHQVETKTVSDDLHILEYVENPFLIDTYIKEISKAKNKEIVYINSLAEVPMGSSVFGEDDLYLYVINKDKLEIDREDYSMYKNTFVITPSLKVKFKKASGVHRVKFPKLVDWQVKTYIKSIAPGLKQPQMDWLYEVARGDIYRLYNEANKLALFENKEQSKIFNLISDEGGFDDLSSYTIYTLSNALSKRDINTVNSVLNEIENIDIEGIGLLALLYRTFKNLINIQLDPKANAKSLGMSDAQFRAISYNKGAYKNTELVNVFKFITRLDRQIKFGEISLRGDKLIDYIICNILTI